MSQAAVEFEVDVPEAVSRLGFAEPSATTTTTGVRRDPASFAEAMEIFHRFAKPSEIDDVLDWASSREDMPEYADSPEEASERSEFYVAISDALWESIERRSA